MRAGLFLAAAIGAAGAAAVQAASTYHNPLPVRLAGGELAQNCADPAVLRDPRAATPTWYLYCTTDPVSRAERDPDGQGGWKFRLMPIYRSTDLVHWDFVADAFAERPPPAAPKAGLWAPEPHYHDGRYYLYYTITDVVDAFSPEPGCGHDSAIGVAVGDGPAGPWVASGKPVVPPRRAAEAPTGCKFDWTFDPDVITDTDGTRYLYYGSYGGGVFVQRLSADGLAVEGAARQVGTTWRYEGAEVVRHDGMWYLFVSATDCCAGPLTGYALHVGRAASPLGPFLDRQGNDLAAVRSGGTPVLAQNGNRWTGPGHNTVLQDAAGQWWTIYHAVDVNEPYFGPGLTRRLAMLDRVDWVDGWPILAQGRGPSDEPLPAPAATADAPPRPAVRLPGAGAELRQVWRDDFQQAPAAPWRWVRNPGTWRTGPEGLAWSTQPGDLHVDTNTAPLLARPLPPGDLRIETRVRLDAPDDCCATNVQAGLVALRDDDEYVKLVVLAGKGLHQIEFAKEWRPTQAGYPRYGNTVAGTPAGPDGWTWLRLDVVRIDAGERWTAWSSQDGRAWVGGGTWTHRLGKSPRVALVAMGGGARAVTFGPVTVSALRRPH